MRRSAEEIYQQFVDFEEQAAEIYLQMAAHFALENKEVSSLWLDLGMQEKEHANLLQFCIAEGLFASPLPADSEIKKVEGLFASSKKRAADPMLSIPDAFQIAAAIETAEVNAIHCHLTSPTHNPIYLLHGRVAISMPDHVEYLLREGRKFGIHEDTLKILEPATERCKE